MIGSTNVNVNGLPALRVDDTGVHGACCGPNMWTATKGSPNVYINGKAAFRVDDKAQLCSGQDAKLVDGSPNVTVNPGGGGGSAGGSGSASLSAGSSSSSGVSPQQGKSGAPASPANAAAASSAANQNQNPNQQPTPATAQWKVEYADGKSVKDVKVKYEGRNGPKDVTGASGSVSVFEGDEYSLTVEGTLKATGVLQDDQGQPVAGAKLKIERAFGDASEVTTDGSGKYEVEGLITDELYDVTIVSTQAKAQLRIVDDKDKPKANLKVRVVSDTGTKKDGVTDADGKLEVEGLLPGEGYSVEVDPAPEPVRPDKPKGDQPEKK